MKIRLKFSALFLLFGLILSSCIKDVENPYASYTPEREASLIKSWRSQMIKNHVNFDSLMVNSIPMYYIMDTTKVGTGPTVKTGDDLTVKYTGAFIDGTPFDGSSSFKYSHKDRDFKLIEGWEAGIELLNKGAKATFLIPSVLAYGPYGSENGTIPPNTPLIFVIEVLDIK